MAEIAPFSGLRYAADRAPDVSSIVIASASHTYNAIHPLVNVPFALTMATELTAHFIAAYA